METKQNENNKDLFIPDWLRNGSAQTAIYDLDKDKVATLIRAIKEKNLVLFVGNGVSRLSGIRSWHELVFNDPSLKKILNEAELGLKWRDVRCTNLTEVSYLKFQKDSMPCFLSEIRSWGKKEENLVHLAIKELNPSKILTTNFDDLLDKTFGKKSIFYFHGNPDEGIVFTINDYLRKMESDDLIKLIEKNLDGDNSALLFIGYSHLMEDLTVSLALYKLHRFQGRIFSLISKSEMKNPFLINRLNLFGICPVVYRLPKNPNACMREFCLANAIYSLLEKARLNPNETFRILLTEREKKLIDITKDPVLAFGLVSLNRLNVPGEFPIKSVRMNVRAGEKEIEEVGGPAYHVCRFLSIFGFPTALVSLGVLDAEGETILEGLKKSYFRNNEKRCDIDEREYPIELELMQWVPEDERAHSWHSFVIIDPSQKGQRVFIDNSTKSPTELSDTKKIVDSAIKYVENRKVPIVYFDKFLGNDIIESFLKKVSERESSRSIVTVYETGSKGSEGFKLENNIKGLVNIVVASYQFATRYLLDESIRKYIDGEKESLDSLHEEIKNIRDDLNLAVLLNINEENKRGDESVEKEVQRCVERFKKLSKEEPQKEELIKKVERCVERFEELIREDKLEKKLFKEVQLCVERFEKLSKEEQQKEEFGKSCVEQFEKLIREDELEKELIKTVKDYVARMKAESDGIEKLIKNEEKREKREKLIRDIYLSHISENAKKWLKKGESSAVVITLHGKGCFWLLPNVNGSPNGYIKGKEGGTNHSFGRYTNSAGDVFRAVFVAALRFYHEKGIDFWLKDTRTGGSKESQKRYYLEYACEIANEIAATKTKYIDVHGELLSEARNMFNEWKKGF